MCPPYISGALVYLQEVELRSELFRFGADGPNVRRRQYVAHGYNRVVHKCGQIVHVAQNKHILFLRVCFQLERCVSPGVLYLSSTNIAVTCQ